MPIAHVKVCSVDGSKFHWLISSLRCRFLMSFNSLFSFCFFLFSFSAEEEESTSGNHSNVATEKVVVPWKLEDQDNSSRYSVSISVKLRK